MQVPERSDSCTRNYAYYLLRVPASAITGTRDHVPEIMGRSGVWWDCINDHDNGIRLGNSKRSGNGRVGGLEVEGA